LCTEWDVVSTKELWSMDPDSLYEALSTTPSGLSQEEAEHRLLSHGPNTLRAKKKTDSLSILLNQFRSPIILILLFSAVLTFLSSDNVDGLIITSIVLLSSLLGFWQEATSARTIEKLLAMIRVEAAVVRGGSEYEVALEDIVPGDLVVLKAGDVIPGDCRLLESKDLFVNEATLTGETLPAEKVARTVTPSAQGSRSIDALYMGTSVVSGTGRAIVLATGGSTELGKISEKLRVKPLATEFERGVARFGYLLMELIFIFVVVIFALNVYFARPVLDSFMFALALAVGITPQLLPAVVSINLAQGAKRMAEDRVIVRRLSSIEDFGTMNLLCSDKTGTVTEGRVKLHSVVDADGEHSEKGFLYAFLNAKFQSGYTNPIDKAILSSTTIDVGPYSKLDEIPYDFVRKRLSVLVKGREDSLLICKGAVRSVLSACSQVETAAGLVKSMGDAQESILKMFGDLSSEGYRTLGIAYRSLGKTEVVTRRAETKMIFLGLLALDDPPKADAQAIVDDLQKRAIGFKIVTGDNELVARHIASEIGMKQPDVLTGEEIRLMSDEALVVRVGEADVFAEVEPNQKERIILALRKSGSVVGYMGDGINDATALHAADVGISVDSAVDVAKEAADIVLLDKDLRVLLKGVDAGRKTFANTMKYIFVTISANFGNMLSMAVASLVLPFLPLLPKQILALNLVTDLPATTISTDRVDKEMVEFPRRWNIRLLTRFMTVFGVQSALFDFLTFIVLLAALHATEIVFQTGWFVLSIVTELLALLIIRTRRPFFKSRPSRELVGATVLVLVLALLAPYTPLSLLLGLDPLPWYMLGALLLITFFYVASMEVVKKRFYRSA
jgi:Mg2+-importing ATPase